jgi:hypothetical protein
MRKQPRPAFNLAVQPRVLEDSERLKILLELNERAFDAQLATSDRLTTKAEKHFAAAAAILTLQLVDIKALNLAGSKLHIAGMAITLLGIIAAIIAATYALVGLRVRAHSMYPSMEETTKDLLSEQHTANTVTLRITTLYLLAADQNQSVNDRRASALACSGILVVIALLLSTTGQLLTRLT